jgi:hypothetical protein
LLQLQASEGIELSLQVTRPSAISTFVSTHDEAVGVTTSSGAAGYPADETGTGDGKWSLGGEGCQVSPY